MTKKAMDQLKAELKKAKEVLAKAADADKEKAQAEVTRLEGELKKAEEASNEVATNAAKAEANAQLEIMDRYKVDKLYRNTKGEYFTNQNLAELSVKDKKDIETLSRENVKSLAK